MSALTKDIAAAGIQGACVTAKQLMIDERVFDILAQPDTPAGRDRMIEFLAEALETLGQTKWALLVRDARHDMDRLMLILADMERERTAAL